MEYFYLEIESDPLASMGSDPYQYVVECLFDTIAAAEDDKAGEAGEADS